MIDLSVVVVSWNTRALLEKCLAAALAALEGLASDRGLAGELIVVDNGSVDGSIDCARSLRAAVHRGGSPRAGVEVVVVALGGNLGFAGGANRGIERARGRVILLLNSDAEVTQAALAAGLAFLDSHPTVGLAGVQLVHPDGRLQNSIHAFPGLLGELVPRFLLELVWPRRFPSKRHPSREALEVEAVLGAALFVQRAAVEQIGPLCEDYFFFLEETDWCYRMRRGGWRVVHLPDVRVMHLSGASSKRRDPVRTRIEFHRSLYLFLARHRGAATSCAVRALRQLRALAGLLLFSPLGLVSGRQRARARSRWALLRWHWRGRPEDAGLSRLGPPIGGGSTTG